jgi:hypothetical protein
VWCINFHCEAGIYRGEWDLHGLGEVGLAPGGGFHRLGEVGLALGGGWPAKAHGRPAGWSGLHRLELLLLV